MADNDLTHLHARRDPSDPWDAIPHPADNRAYPNVAPQKMSARERESWQIYHADLTGATCTCGWCNYGTRRP